MNKRKKQFLALIIGAMCIGDVSYTLSVNAYGQDNLDDESISSVKVEENDNKVTEVKEDFEQASEKEIDTKEQALQNIKKGEATVEDYKALGFYEVNEGNYEGITLFLKGKDLSLDELNHIIVCLTDLVNNYRKHGYVELDDFKIEELESLSEEDKEVVDRMLYYEFDNKEEYIDSELLTTLYNEIQNVKLKVMHN